MPEPAQSVTRTAAGSTLEGGASPHFSRWGWVGATLVAAVAGWTSGAHALGPVTVPGPTHTQVVQITMPAVPHQSASPQWSADPASPHPAGIPEGRHLVSAALVGDYVGIPANPARPCEWQREGVPSAQTVMPPVIERGATDRVAWTTIRKTDHSFFTSGCQWKLTGR